MKFKSKQNGVEILLTGCEVALAIDVFIHSQDVIVDGARTIRDCGGELLEEHTVFCHGRVIRNGDLVTGEEEEEGRRAASGSMSAQDIVNKDAELAAIIEKAHQAGRDSTE
jgi:hypothetical protein